MMIKKSLFLLFLGIFLGGCSLDDDSPNFHFSLLRAESVDLPEFFELNETYRITVDYVLPDGCTFFDRFNVTDGGTTIRNVVAVGATRTDVEACTTEIVEGQAFFNFVVIYDQPYTFRFYQGEDTEGEPQFLEVIVPVVN